MSAGTEVLLDPSIADARGCCLKAVMLLFCRLLQAGKASLRDSQPSQALQPLAEADSIAQELRDFRARRAVLRVRAQALQQVIL